jgi:hypothetical protein
MGALRKVFGKNRKQETYRAIYRSQIFPALSYGLAVCWPYNEEDRIRLESSHKMACTTILNNE